MAPNAVPSSVNVPPSNTGNSVDGFAAKPDAFDVAVTLEGAEAVGVTGALDPALGAIGLNEVVPFSVVPWPSSTKMYGERAVSFKLNEANPSL